MSHLLDKDAETSSVARIARDASVRLLAEGKGGVEYTVGMVAELIAYAEKIAPPVVGMKDVDALTVVYTNHRGVTAIRRIWPVSIWYGSNQWHPEPQWLLKAVDMDNGEERDFAFAKMKGAT